MANMKRFLLFGKDESINKYAVFVDEFTTDIAAGSVNGTYSSDGKAKRVVTDTGTELSVSGGSAVIAAGNGDGDPGLWYTDTADAAFSVGAGSALLISWKPTEADKVYKFGFDSNTAGAPDTPRIITASGAGDGLIQLEDAVGAKTIGSMTNGTEKTHLFMQRSGTHGFHVLEHVSGKQWKRLYVDTSAEIGSGSVYPMFTSNNGACTISRIALLDLSDFVDADFSEVTDAETNPASGTTFDCEADSHISWSFTEETGTNPGILFRRTDNDNCLKLIAHPANDTVYLYKVVASASTLIGTGPVLADGTAYDFDIVCYGSSIKVFIDKVLQITATESTWQTVAGGSTSHDLVTNDIVITTYPYPALGGSVLGATDRVVCPQLNDTGIVDEDCYVTVRDIIVP